MKNINSLLFFFLALNIHALYAMNTPDIKKQQANLDTNLKIIKLLGALNQISTQNQQELETLANQIKKDIKKAATRLELQPNKTNQKKLNQLLLGVNHFSYYILNIKALAAIAQPAKQELILPLAQFLTELDIEIVHLLQENAIREDRAKMVQALLREAADEMVEDTSLINNSLAISALKKEKENLLKTQVAFRIENEISEFSHKVNTYWQEAVDNKEVLEIDAQMALQNIYHNINQLRVNVYEEKVFDWDTQLDKIEKLNDQLFAKAVAKKKKIKYLLNIQQLTYIYDTLLDQFKKQYADPKLQKELSSILKDLSDLFLLLKQKLKNGKITLEQAEVELINGFNK